MADENPKKQTDDELPPLNELLGDDELPPLDQLLSDSTPVEKKNDGVSKSGGGSSGLPKIKYDGKEYGYNPSTLQVFQADGTELKQVKHLGKTYDVKDYLTNVIGVKPKQVDNTEYDFKTGFADRQQGAISAAQAPDVQSDRLIKRNKKFPSIKDNPQVAAAFDAYDNLKNAAANTADKQNEYDLFLKTGTLTDENGQDIRPLGAIPTDVLGTTTVVEGSPAAQIKKNLEANLKKAKEDENKAYDDLGNKENTFRNAKLPELPVKKELGADKYEYEMPSQVNVLNFMQGLSNLEDHASGQGLSLKQYSDSVENIAADAFLSPDQQNLFKELNSGDERAARSAIARYDENIDKQINAINKQLALGATPAQKAYLINERTRLTDQKSDFFSPRKAIEAVGTLNPQLKPVFDSFAGIGDQDKASLVYAKVFKDSQDLADELIGQPLFIDQDGKQVINPKVTDYLVGGQDSPFRRKSADKRELLQKNINTLELLAPATLLNRRPLEKKGSFIESFGKTIAKGIGFDTGFTQTMVETDKPSVIANFLADATVSTKDLPTNQAKQLEQIGKQNNWEFAGSTLGYLIPAGVQLAVGGAELVAMKFITSALKRTSTAADLAYDIIKLTKGSSMLNKAVKMGADAQLGGWTFSDPEMGFANIGAESLAGELFEKAIKKLPGGALVTKVAKKVFADNYITALNKIGKMNAYGLGETTGEFAGSLVQLYQDSDTWNDFYDKFQQQFGKAEENLKFFLSCYTLGGVMGNHAAPATKAVQNAADKAYQKLTPDEKKIADEIIENDVDATNVATVDVLRNNVGVIPDADLKTRIEQVKKAKADLDALPDLKANTQNAGSPYIVPSKQGEVKNAKDGAYEIKVGDITLSGNTPEQLANDKDLINSLDLIYSGEQQRREAEGITVETPPIETGEVNPQATGAEAGVGVEGESPIKAANTPETAQPDVADIERRRKQLRGKALEAIGVDERHVDGSKYEAHSKAKDYSFDRAITLAENQITANPISKLGALPMDAANAIKAELHIAGVKATDKTPLSEINDKLKEIKAKYDAELAALQTTEILPQEGEVKETVSDTQVSEPLKDVQSTTDAIKKLKVSDLPQDLVDTYVKGNSDGHVRIAKAYHKAKADKSNPDLVNAVEELLASKAAPVAEPSNTIETETKDGTKVEEIKPSKVAGFNEGVDAVKKNAEEYKKILNEKRKQQNPSAKPARANEPVPKLFTAVSKMIADAYNSITHQPSKEEVKEAYDALVEETAAQYNFIVSKGLKVERHAGKGEPYANSKEMLKDIKENNTLKFLPNDVAFGQGTTDVSDNIGLQPSGIKLKDGYELTNSEVFRIVHDYFGHGILGNEFGAIGEENATLQHLDLYSDVAAPAVIFQTRGQNSWVNYSGVNDKANELRKQARELKKQGKLDEAKKLLEEADKIFKFAEPKIAIFPTKFNFKRYETARRIAEKAQVDGRPDKRVNGLSRLLESLSSKSSRATRGVNKRSIREVKRLGGFSVKVKAEYTLDSKINQGIVKAFPNFKGVQKIYEVADGKVFREMMLAALKTNKFASSVTVHSAEEFDGMRMFVTEDGSTGVTLTKDGFIGGGFSDPSVKRPNNIAQLLILGIKEGATTAEAFDTILPDYYAQFGLKAVARVDFNDELKPDGWDNSLYEDYNNGKPDVVFFIFDGGDRNTIEDRIGLFDLYGNYEKANTKQFDKDSYGEAVDFMKQAAVKRLEFDLGIEPTVEAAPTTAERKAEFTAKVDDLAAKLKAKLGTDPNVQKMGIGADDVVDFIAEVVKEAGKAAIDVAEALKTAKAKLKELGVPDDLINEGEAKYTGATVSPITPEQADKLLTTGPDRNNTIRALSPDVAAVAKTVTDNRGFAAFERVFNNVDNKYDDTLKALEKALGVKKIC